MVYLGILVVYWGYLGCSGDIWGVFGRYLRYFRISKYPLHCKGYFRISKFLITHFFGLKCVLGYFGGLLGVFKGCFGAIWEVLGGI